MTQSREVQVRYRASRKYVGSTGTAPRHQNGFWESNAPVVMTGLSRSATSGCHRATERYSPAAAGDTEPCAPRAVGVGVLEGTKAAC
jgi:hypothetical protein